MSTREQALRVAGGRPKGRRAKDLTNLRIGNIVVVSSTTRRMTASGALIWQCRCDCGKTFYRASCALRRTQYSKHPEHAVCSHACPLKARGVACPQYLGVGDLSAQKWGNIRGGARRRGLSFTVTIKQAWSLFLAQGCRCALTGIPLTLSPSSMAAGASTASLDRIDSTKGYVSGNVQWVHVSINLMKQTLSVDDFVVWCERVTAFAYASKKRERA